MPNFDLRRAGAAATLALFACAASVPQAAAEDARPDGLRGTIGLGAGFAPEYEGADETQVIPFGFASLKAFGLGFELRGPGLAVDLFGNDATWHAGPEFRFAFERDADDPQVAALGDTDLALEAGGFVGFDVPAGGLKGGTFSGRLSVRQDVLDGHEGLLVSPDIGYGFMATPRMRVRLGASTTWASEGYMDTYFSVDAAGSAASGIPVYDAESGFKDVAASALVTYALDENWGLFTRLAYTRLIGDAADSPIVKDHGDADQYFGGAGVSYRF